MGVLQLLSVVAIAALLPAAPASAQRLVGALSDRTISINSSFAGETLTLFGNVEPDIGVEDTSVQGPFDVIVVVRGPAIDRVVRRKTPVLGIWLNTEQVLFRNYPSFHWVLANDDLANITSSQTLRDLHVLPGSEAGQLASSGNGDSTTFANELSRLMTERFLFGVNNHGVRFQSQTLFSAQISLPADVPNGNFLTQTYLFKDGELIASKSEGFAVRKTGFERFVGDAANHWPYAYGLVAVGLAIFTGWLGGVVFRR